MNDYNTAEADLLSSNLVDAPLTIYDDDDDDDDENDDDDDERTNVTSTSTSTSSSTLSLEETPASSSDQKTTATATPTSTSTSESKESAAGIEIEVETEDEKDDAGPSTIPPSSFELVEGTSTSSTPSTPSTISNLSTEENAEKVERESDSGDSADEIETETDEAKVETDEEKDGSRSGTSSNVTAQALNLTHTESMPLKETSDSDNVNSTSDPNRATDNTNTTESSAVAANESGSSTTTNTTEKSQAKPVDTAQELGSSHTINTTNTTEISQAEKELGLSFTNKTTEKLEIKTVVSGRESGSSAATNTIKTTTVGTSEDLALVLESDATYDLWKATKEQFDATRPWKNASTFTTVDRDAYQQLVEKAHVSMQSLVEDVYTDCELYILPDLQNENVDKEWIEKPRVQFKCLGIDDPVFQDDLCHTANMCRVVLDKEAWKEELSLVSSNMNISSDNDNSKKSALLMMFDGIDYMMESVIFKATINKAAYAYRSNRPLYVWIGNLDQTELNKRENESLEPAFGTKCAEQHVENSMHYYKPIAFLVLFDILSSSSPSSESILYLDADTDFTPTAFKRIGNENFNGTSNESDSLAPMGPESYLDISPQASLVGTQNTAGKILMNSGIIILRDTRWSKDFLAMWWYGRCGPKDQLAMWLVLYATFSAWTTMSGDNPLVGTQDESDVPTQFAYPPQVFYDYSAASNKLFMHFRRYGYGLQATWEAVVERRRKEQSEKGIETDDDENYYYPIPSNTKLFNGGGGEIKPKLSAPIELPHVLILSPVKNISFNKTIEDTVKDTVKDGTSSTVQVDLPKLKSSDNDNHSFVHHSKSLQSCSDGRCWPYIKD
jgi:hypothetical protein